MITEHPITKERVRGFYVFVCREKGLLIKNAPKKKVFYYQRQDTSCSHRPYFSGEEALKTMKTLSGRGFDVLAYTDGSAGPEELNLNEMKDLYDKTL